MRSSKKATGKTFFCEGKRLRLKNLKKKKSLSITSMLTIYGRHKKYSDSLEKEGERRANLLECITESLVCMHQSGCYRIESSEGNKKGDIYDQNLRILIESKATQGKGPSSFSPESLSELFYYTRLNPNTDGYEIYVFSREEVKAIKVSKGYSIGRIWSSNKKRKKKIRPRVNLLDCAIEMGKLPKFVGHLNKSFLSSLKKATRETSA